MVQDIIERYDTFNDKGFPNELLFGDFFYQPIPPGYYEFLNDNDGYYNNTPGTPIDDVSPDTKLVEFLTVMPNAPNADDNYDEDNNDTEYDDTGIDTSAIDSLQDNDMYKVMNTERVDEENEVVEYGDVVYNFGGVTIDSNALPPE